MPTRLLLVVALVGSLVSTALAAPTSHLGSGSGHPLAPDQVIVSLYQTLAWYREARQAMRGVGSVFGREDEETAVAVLRAAFETARAQTALLAASTPAESTRPAETGPLAGKRSEIQAAIEADQQEVERLQQRLHAASPAQSPTLQDGLAAAMHRLELDLVRLDFLTKLESSQVSSPSTDLDLAHQIETLETSLPELRSTAQAAPPVAASVSGSAGGNWGLVQRMIGIYHTQRNLDRLARRTAVLERRIARDIQADEASSHPVVSQLRTLAADPSPNGSLAEGQKTFRTLLQQSEQLTAVIVSMQGQSALLRRFASDLEGWDASLDRERWLILQSLGLSLIGVGIALASILVGGMFWRVATMRYVRDLYRRRLLLMARNVVVVTTMALVLVFHFASEFTTLVTGLGFAAAGIAFALQNVILALAGYFSMVAPNGIRIGDRVGLQGPFSYVQGEVIDIGLVRIRLRELAGDPLRPTGRIVVFPNSVVFTGSFFKHPAGTEEAQGDPTPHRGGLIARQIH